MTNEEVRALIARTSRHIEHYRSTDGLWSPTAYDLLDASGDALTALLARAEAAESALATVRRGVQELIACCDAAKDKAWLTEPDPLIERTQAAWRVVRALAEQPKE